MNKNENPFISSLNILYMEFNHGTNEATQEPIRPYEVEAERFSRLYNDRARRLYLFKLSIYARDIFMSLQYFTYNDNHYAILSYEKMEELLGKDVMYSKRKFEDSIRELVKNNIIDYKDRKKNQYWYNPVYYSPGSRLKVFPTATKTRVN